MRGQAERMADALRPYGVDRCDVTHDRSVGSVRTLTHRTPEDLVPRPPPHAADDPRVVADARIDNRDEVVRALGLTRAAAGGIPDHELIELAFKAWGVNLTEHVVGAFAVGVLDRRRGRVHCIRDHLGQRPLFYHQGRGFFAFASMPTALYALDEIPCLLDEVKMAELILGCHGQVDASPFRGISRLPGGCTLSADRDALHVSRYWDVANAPQVSLSSDADYAEAAHALLQTTTRSQLRAAQPVGLMLSGGLDSSGIACVAARELARTNRRLVALHRRPPPGLRRTPPANQVLDETEFVESVGRRYPNIDTIWVSEGPRSPLEGLAARMRACQRPVLRAANHNWFHPLWSMAGAQGVGVLLGGGSGGLTLGWSGQRELATLARAGDWGTLGALIPDRARWLNRGSSSILLHQVVRPIVSETIRRVPLPWAKNRDLSWLIAVAPLNPTLGEELRLGERLREAGWVGDERRAHPRDLRIRQARYYEDVVGEIHAGIGALYGFELRDPYRDKRLADFCFGIPVSQYLVGGPDRSLLRRACRGVVPDDILARRKKGAQASDWAERLLGAIDEMADEVDRIARSPLASRMLDVPRMRALLTSDRLSRWARTVASAGEGLNAGADRAIMVDYSGVLLQGITAGLFIRWVEEACPN